MLDTAARTPLPVEARPHFAALMVAAWRLQNLNTGTDVTVVVRPDEWPSGTDPADFTLRRDECGRLVDRPGAVLVLGRVGRVWRGAANLAITANLAAAGGSAPTPADIARTTRFVELGASLAAGIAAWLAPSAHTGDVPIWTAPAGWCPQGQYPRTGAPS
jgi:hypothetical protein